jgi:hypothetical protein
MPAECNCAEADGREDRIFNVGYLNAPRKRGGRRPEVAAPSARARFGPLRPTPSRGRHTPGPPDPGSVRSPSKCGETPANWASPDSGAISCGTRLRLRHWFGHRDLASVYGNRQGADPHLGAFRRMRIGVTVQYA